MAVVGVILIHMTMQHYYDPNLMSKNYLAWISSHIYYTISRFCVPVFFIIAAYISFNNKSQKGLASRLIRIGIPFITWSVIYYVYNGGGSFIEFIIRLFTRSTSFHLWFIAPFIGFMFALPLVKHVFYEEGKDKFKYLFWVVFFFTICLPSIIAYSKLMPGDYGFLSGLNQFNLTFPSFLLYAMAFPYMHKKVRVLPALLIYFALLSLNSWLNLNASGLAGKPDERFYGFNTLIVFLSSYVIFNIVMSLDFSWLPNTLTRFVLTVGECSFGVYLVHWLVFIVLEKYEFVMRGRAIVDPAVNTLIIFLVSVFIVWLARRIKFFRYFV